MLNNFAYQTVKEFPDYMEAGKAKLLAMKKAAEDGNWTWRLGGLISGIIMIVLGSMDVLNHLSRISPFDAIIDVYIVMAGFIAILLEHRNQMLTREYLLILEREARFLCRPFGRACFYLFVGTLLVSIGGILGFLGGLFIIIVGIAVLTGSRTSYQVLKQLQQEQYNKETITAKFYEYDKNRSGYLDSAEVSSLCTSLGTTLSRNELESALFILDKNGDGKISLAEFLIWWSREDADPFLDLF